LNNTALASRPKIDVPRSSTEVILEFASLLGIIFIIYLLWRYWGALPARIPTHYNFSGQPDGWGGKGTLLILPGVTFFIFIMLTVLERFPRIYNYPVVITPTNAARQYVLARMLLSWLKFEIVWFFAYIEWKTIQVGLGQAGGFGPAIVLFFVGATIASTVIYFWQARLAK
jgi:uncharacterized membrane protein